MEKGLFILFGIFVAVVILTGAYLFHLNNQVKLESSIIGEWKLNRVMVDGELAPNLDQESYVDVVYYWNEQSLEFQPDKISGFDGCNSYIGNLKWNHNGNIEITRIWFTLEGCRTVYTENSDGTLDIFKKYDSSKFRQDLLSVDRFELNKDTLILIDEGPQLKELYFSSAD